MVIVGCDLHKDEQSVAVIDLDTGELTETVLVHGSEELDKFYTSLPAPARIGVEATGYSEWFAELVARHGHELWVGHPARIRAADERKQKHDRRDARLLARLLAENRFPVVWVPPVEARDLRRLLLHRHHLVRLRSQVQNMLQSIALNRGLRLKHRLWSQAGLVRLSALELQPHNQRRRSELLALYRQLNEWIEALNADLKRAGEQRPRTQLLLTHPGVGVLTAMATDLILGPVERFASPGAVASYVGIIPSNYSSGGHQRHGRVTKQGSPLLRFFWVEAAQAAVRGRDRDERLHRMFTRLVARKGWAIASVAVAHKLGERLYIMLRDRIDYAEFCRRGALQGAHAGMAD
jgi:transposase